MAEAANPTDALADYLDARQRQRDERVDVMLAAMTPRERRLVREAAVMGFVQGRMSSGGTHPQDTAVMRHVLAACDHLPDLYPITASLGGPERVGLPTYEQVYQAWHATTEGWGGCADKAAIGRVTHLFTGEDTSDD